MSRFTDPAVSPLPIRLVDRNVDASKLRLLSIVVDEFGHIPGRIMYREDIIFDH